MDSCRGGVPCIDAQTRDELQLDAYLDRVADGGSICGRQAWYRRLLTGQDAAYARVRKQADDGAALAALRDSYRLEADMALARHLRGLDVVCAVEEGDALVFDGVVHPLVEARHRCRSRCAMAVPLFPGRMAWARAPCCARWG